MARVPHRAKRFSAGECQRRWNVSVRQGHSHHAGAADIVVHNMCLSASSKQFHEVGFSGGWGVVLLMPELECRKDYGDSAMGAAFIGALCYYRRELLPILVEHMAYYDCIIPHILMEQDIMGWVIENRGDPSRVQPVLDWLEDAYVQAERENNFDVQEIIVFSGIEAIPMPGKPGHEIRWLLGKGLAKEADIWFSPFERGREQ